MNLNVVESIASGNQAFVRGDYVDAYKNYSLACKTATNSSLKATAYTNRAVSLHKLGMKTSSTHDIAEAIETHVQSEFIGQVLHQLDDNSDEEQEPVVYSKHMQEERKKIIQDVKSGAWLKSLNTINDIIAQNVWNTNPYADRCVFFTGCDDYRNAFQDSQTVTSMNPTSGEHWYTRAQCAATVRNTETLYIAATKAQSYGYSVHLYFGIYYNLLHQDDLALNEFNLAVANCEAGAIATRVLFYYSIGKYRTAFKDCFANPECLPLLHSTYHFIVTPKATKAIDVLVEKYPNINVLISSYFKSYKCHIYSVPHDIFIPIGYQRIWHRVGNHSIGDPPTENNSIAPLFPHDMVFDLPQENVVKQLYKLASNLGEILGPNKRKIICYGMAILEIVQIIKHQRKYSNFNVILSMAVNWVRFIDPYLPIFWRFRSLAITNYTVLVIETSRPTDYYNFAPRLMQKVKEYISVHNPDYYEKIASIADPEELWQEVKSTITIEMPDQSHSIVLQSRKHGLIDFGLVYKYDGTQLENVVGLWYSFVSSIKANEVNDLPFLFLYKWMRSNPLTNFTEMIGSLLFNAMFQIMYNKRITENMPTPYDLYFEAILANSYIDFKNYLKSVNMVLQPFDQEIDEIPLLSDALPNLLIRLLLVNGYTDD